MTINRRIAAFAGLILFVLSLASGSTAQDARPDAVTVIKNWYTVALELTRHTATYSPPVASRTYAYLGVTAFEAAVGGSETLTSLVGQLHGLDAIPAREAGAEYDDAVVLNAALSTNILILYGNTGPTGQHVMATADKKFRDSVIEGVATDVVERSEAYGKAVAAAIMAWSQGDGAIVENMGFPVGYQVAKGPGLWVPTSAIVQQQVPLLPEWGNVRTFASPDGVACPTKGAIAYSEEPGSRFYLEAKEVYDAVVNLSPENRAIARFWSDDPMLSTTPPGHWINIGLQLIDQQSLTLDDSVDMMARLGVVMADAFIGCWHEKFVYNLIRPISYIKKVIDPKWEPVLNTPPFPEYPSGHSTVSGAAAAVLTAMFGDNFKFGDGTGSRDGLVNREFPSFNAAADEAALSRLLGGIHYRAAIEDGLAQGRCIAEYTIALNTRR